MKLLRGIIIDDEEAGIETIKILAERYPTLIKIVAASQKPEEGITMIEDYRPDVVFLDVNMPGMSGFDLLQKLSFKNFKLVFTTAHKQYAIEAIKNRAFDYLLKPIDDHDFKLCLEEIQKNEIQEFVVLKSSTLPLLEIQVKDGIQYLKQQDIIRVEASRSYTTFYLEGGIKHLASKSLKEFEDKLDPNIFYKCHRSHIINLHKVQKFVSNNGYFALMNDGSLADISKANKDDFLKRLQEI
jgi:two-component system, LytTR family, response regulator